MTKLKSPVKEALKFHEKIYIDLGSHWILKSCLWGRPEKSLGTPGLGSGYFAVDSNLPLESILP